MSIIPGSRSSSRQIQISRTSASPKWKQRIGCRVNRQTSDALSRSSKSALDSIRKINRCLGGKGRSSAQAIIERLNLPMQGRCLDTWCAFLDATQWKVSWWSCKYVTINYIRLYHIIYSANLCHSGEDCNRSHRKHWTSAALNDSEAPVSSETKLWAPAKPRVKSWYSNRSQATSVWI